MSEILDTQTAHTAAHAMACIFVSPGAYTAQQLESKLGDSHQSDYARVFVGAMSMLAMRQWIAVYGDEQPPTLKATSGFVQRAVEMRMQVTSLPMDVQQRYDRAVNACRQFMESPESTKTDALEQFLGVVAVLGQDHNLESDGKEWFPGAAGWEVLATVEANDDKLT